ncbi:MAG: alkaline phosphatase [Acidimicrobiales bacterium]|nr:alkaline phosphatase [Acidimicrobiales bacterium]
MEGDPTGGPTGAWSRRAFLAGLAATGVAACSDGGHADRAGPPRSSARPARRGVPDPRPRGRMPSGLFALGVASGDPLPDGFVLWTRLAPAPIHGGGMPPVDVPVRWQVANDERFTDVVADGLATASPRWGHAVHVDVRHLQPARTYWYRFTTAGQASDTGRTRTAPAQHASVERLRFLFASCQNWKDGYWTAWPHAANEDVDLVAFLGDYIYESGRSGGQRVRQHNSDEVTTLATYRDRYGLYKSDPGLQAAHAAAPWVITWDDHEVENNYAGVESQDRVPVAEFRARRAAAYQAFWEHQPVRTPPPTGDALKLYRTLRWGRLADLVVLDGRQYRSDQPCAVPGDIGSCAARSDPAGTMLGATQKRWLERELASAAGRWTVLANQVIMTPLPIGPVFNLDQWDGYPAERTEVLSWLDRVRNPVVITGDIHANGVGDLRDEPAGSPVVGTELVGTSISSSFDPALLAAAEALIGPLPQVKWFEGHHRGYVRCDVNATEWRADFRGVDTVRKPKASIKTIRSWRIEDGRAGAQEA